MVFYVCGNKTVLNDGYAIDTCISCAEDEHRLGHDQSLPEL